MQWLDASTATRKQIIPVYLAAGGPIYTAANQAVFRPDAAARHPPGVCSTRACLRKPPTSRDAAKPDSGSCAMAHACWWLRLTLYTCVQ